MNEPLKTDWARLGRMTDEEVDTSDITELDDDFFERATLCMPESDSVALEKEVADG